MCLHSMLYIRLTKHQLFLSKNEREVLKDTGDSRLFKAPNMLPQASVIFKYTHHSVSSWILYCQFDIHSSQSQLY